MHEQVHIVPLGFEVDRAAAPFESKRFLAHRVYLLAVAPGMPIRREMVERQRGFVQAVKRRLLRAGVPSVIVVPANTLDLGSVAGAVAGIVRQEMGRKNEVYVNMSAAGRLASVGATLAGMLHRARVYYVTAEDYRDSPEIRSRGLSVSTGEYRMLDNLSFEMPDDAGMELLSEIHNQGVLGSWGALRALARAGVLFSPPLPETERDFIRRSRGVKSKYLMRLKYVASKLAESDCITVSQRGREKEYRLTPFGEFMVHLGGRTPSARG